SRWRRIPQPARERLDHGGIARGIHYSRHPDPTIRVGPMLRNLLLAALALVAVGASTLGADLPPDLRAAICGKRATCSIAAVSDAGRGPGDVKQAVVEARFGVADKLDSAPDDGCRTDGDNNDGGREFWLLQGAEPPKLLLSLCNDGYGAADVGEDEVTV